MQCNHRVAGCAVPFCRDADPIMLAQEMRPAIGGLPVAVIGFCQCRANNEDVWFKQNGFPMRGTSKIV